MKKAVNFFITALLAICMIFPLAACGEKEKAEELPTKRIIGLDSEKTYAKGEFYIDNNNDVDWQDMYLYVLSYDRIEKDELEAITFHLSYLDIYPDVGDESPITELKCEEFELKFGETINKDGYYTYMVVMCVTADKVSNGFVIDSINMTIAGR